MQRSLPALPSKAYRSCASRYCTVSLRSLTLGALSTRIRFSLERSAASRSKYVKSEWYQGAVSTCYIYCHTTNFIFFHAHQPHSDMKRCVQPYRSSLCATVAKQHHRWARAAIEEPDVVQTMYENISSFLLYSIFATLQVNVK